MVNKSDEDFWLKQQKLFNALDPDRRRKAQWVAKSINYLSLVVGFTYIFFPVVPSVQFCYLLVVPWLVLILVKRQPDYYRAFSFEESPYEGFNLVFLSACVSLMAKGYYQFTLLHYNNLLWITLVLCLPLSLLFYRLVFQEFQFGTATIIAKTTLLFAVFIPMALYLGAALYILNCALDYSPSFRTNAFLVDKYSFTEDENTPTEFALEIEFQDEFDHLTTLNVDEQRWNNFRIGQPLQFKIRKGWLGGPWCTSFVPVNHLDFGFKIATDSDRKPLNSSYTIIATNGYVDTLRNTSDSTHFQLCFDREYIITFGSEGYQSKTILFDTKNVPESIVDRAGGERPGAVNLFPLENLQQNNTVARFFYDPEKADFYFEFFANQTRVLSSP